MKNNKLELVFVMMVFLVLLTAIMNNNTTTEKENIDINSYQPPNFNTSANWYLTIDNISINDAATGVDAHNWTWAEKQDWCRGSGTWEDPYIIENITMNVGGIESGITIENSNVSFVIRNCTIFNTGSLSEDAGIKLINVNNSQLIGNNFLDIGQIGIYLKMSCINNTISNNFIFENYPDASPYIIYGIYLYNQCMNNTINNNKIHRINQFGTSDRGGIQLEDNCNYNIIENNLINQSKHGLYLTNKCKENTLFNNSIIHNTGNGIYIETQSDANKIYNNTIDFNNYGIKTSENILFPNNNLTIHHNKLFNNSIYGISISYSRSSNIWENELYGCGFRIESDNITYHRELSLSKNNTVNGKPVYYYVEKSGLDVSDFYNAGQIILIDCNHTNLANFNLSFCSRGIYICKVNQGGYVGSSYNHTILNITLQGNVEGIYSRNSHNINISNIIAKANGKGIFLVLCNNCTINNCTLKENTDNGLDIYQCSSNNITNNYIKHNNKYGINFGLCEYSRIKNNTISDNAKDGLYIYYSSKSNIISNNTISNNSDNGIHVDYDSDSNIISNNTISNNKKNGIYLNGQSYNCNNNNITLNQICYNEENGIYLDNCGNNNISLNFISYNKGHGIYIYDSSKLNIISNNTVYDNNQNGIYINFKSDNNNITGNLIKKKKSDFSGILIDNSTNIFITENEMNYCGLFLSGSISQLKSLQIDDTNQVNQKKLYYYVDQFGLGKNSFSNAGQIILINCSDSFISNANVSCGSVGIMLYLCDNITIKDTISSDNNLYGIHLEKCNYTTIYNNNISNNDVHGIKLIRIGKSANITQNRIINNHQFGIFLDYSYNSCIIRNLIEGNKVKGLRLEHGSNYNLIYYNSFINNSQHAFDNGGKTNSWDNVSLGNYWDDYTGGDNNNDGIGDTPYYINGSAGSIDHYPIWGKPSIGAGLPSNGEKDSSEEKDNKNNVTPYVLGGVIIGSIIAIFIGLQVYSKKHPLKKGKKIEEPFLESPPEEAHQLKTKKTTEKAPQTKSEAYIQKPKGIDDFDLYSIQKKLNIKSQKTNDLYDEIIRNNSTISNYLESDISIDDIPEGERLVATTLSEEDLRKIDLIDLPADDKKTFLKEILSLNKKERKRLLDDLLKNIEGNFNLY